MPDEGNIRRSIQRTLTVITWIQLCLAIGAIVCGCLAVVFTYDQVDTSGPPYFIGSFMGGGLILVAATCLLYLRCSKYPLNDADTLDQCATKSVYTAVRLTRVCLVFAIVGCVIGVLFNVVFGIIPCDPGTWLSACYFNQNITENRVIAIVTTCILSASMIVSFYAVCFHGWAFVKKCNNSQEPEVHRTSGFQPVEMFDIEERNSDEDRGPARDYNKMASFRQTTDDDAGYPGYQEPLRQKHVAPAQQSRNYVAVLNDPAMKQKLQERSNRLQT